MATGLSSYAATALLNALYNNTSLAVTQAYIQLHTGDPGANGTANAAGNTTRKSVSFGAASGAAISNDAAVSWTSGEVTTSEDYTHWSLWDASTSGNFLQSGTMTANAVASGDEFTIPIGELDLAQTVAS